jgi:rhodanese-related sulfurtransferase
VPAGTTVVTYCWGPGCNGATRAALAFARLGYPVKEMIGGYEYWVREG